MRFGHAEHIKRNQRSKAPPSLFITSYFDIVKWFWAICIHISNQLARLHLMAGIFPVLPRSFKVVND